MKLLRRIVKNKNEAKKERELLYTGKPKGRERERNMRTGKHGGELCTVILFWRLEREFKKSGRCLG